MSQSEYNIYQMIRNANKDAEELNFHLAWSTSGWNLLHPDKRTGCTGETVYELHHYLNGYRDGLRTKEIEGE